MRCSEAKWESLVWFAQDADQTWTLGRNVLTTGLLCWQGLHIEGPLKKPLLSISVLPGQSFNSEYAKPHFRTHTHTAFQFIHFVSCVRIGTSHEEQIRSEVQQRLVQK